MSLLRIFSILLIVFTFSSCKFPGEYFAVQPSQELIMRYRKYIQSDEEIIAKSFTHISTKLPNGDMRIRYFYPEKYQCTHEMTFSGENGLLKGPYKEWWDDGFKKDEGQYENNKKVGLWKNYSLDDGTLVSEKNYLEGELHGLEKTYRNTYLKSSYTYDMGIRSGEFMIYDSTGIIINEGIYKADTIFKQTLIPEKMETFKQVETMPMYPGCLSIPEMDERKSCAQKKMLTFIYSNIKYPSDARAKDIQGTAIIRFVVDTDGKITDIKTARGICKSIEEECLRIVHAMPDWHPGIQRDKPVKVAFNLPIKFKLQ